MQWGVVNVSAITIAADEKRPVKDALGFVAQWLGADPERIATLAITSKPGGSVGPSKRVELTFGKNEVKLLDTPIAQVVEGLMREPKQGEFIADLPHRQRLCQLEFYRRIKINPASAFEALSASNWIKRADNLDELGYLLLRFNPELSSTFILTQFDAGPHEVQLALVKSDVMLQPKSISKGFFDLWKKLSQSEDPIFKHEAEGALKWYEAHDSEGADDGPKK